MSAPVWLMATAAGMFRAPEGARYPWTADYREARHFASASAARAEIRSHAAITARNVRDYHVFRLGADSLEIEPASSGDRFALSPYAERYLIANEASDGETLTFRAHTPDGRGRWTDSIDRATRWPSRDFARNALNALEAERPRAGRRFVMAEQITPQGLAHAELTPDEIAHDWHLAAEADE